MTSPLVPFFCVVKVRDMKVVAWRSLSDQVIGSIARSSTWSSTRCRACVFSRAEEKIKGHGDEVGNGVTIGSGGRCEGLVEYEDDDDDWNWFNTGRRRVFISVTTELARDPEVNGTEGVLADVSSPRWANAWPTTRTASSTVPDQTALRRGALRPSRYRCAKTWTMGIGSGKFLRNGSMSCARQNFSQWTQCAHAALAHLAVTPRRVFSWTRQRSVRKASLFEGGTCATALSKERKR
jgi:hypothetical protein